MRTTMRLLVPLMAVLLLGTGSRAESATYQFDLSALLDGEGDLPQGLAVDLGTKFSQIESATLKLEGIFTPGKSIPIYFEDPWGILDPPLEVDDQDVYLESGGSFGVWARMGDEQLPNLTSPAHATWSLTGSAGQVQVESLLQSAGLFSTGVSPGPLDLSFLQDGKFNLTMGSLQIDSFHRQVIENPEFQLHGLVLEVAGTAVPEPGSAALIASACGLALAGWRIVRHHER